ncbi:MAG TPA: hypothetical protein VJ063_01310 [Verrucomicrobiae bacterium]|nr:hypothetical protein [Verrucomicrobiae bacterium]
MKIRQWLLFAALPLWFGCKSAAPAVEKIEPPASTPALSISTNIPPYLRIAHPATNLSELQVAVRQFLPQSQSQPVVWLVGASHVGESNYYGRLQKLLNSQDLVLFEGVTDRASRAAGRKTFQRGDEDLGSLQNTMAESLGLAFQLDAINYERPHFRNSDLTIEQIAQLIAKEGPPGGDKQSKTAKEFQNLLEMMQGDSLVATLVSAGMKLIGSSPKLQAMMKLMMIEVLGRFKGDMSQFQGLPPEWQRLIEILVHARNEAVLKDLQTEIGKPAPPKSIAVFYGAAHMEDMQRRLTRELGYRPGREEWLPAFSVDVAKAQISDAELKFVQSFVDWQMQMLEKQN